MPTGTKGVERLTVSDEHCRLVFTNDELGSEAKFPGSCLGNTPHDLVRTLVGPLDQIKYCQSGFSC